MTNSDERTEPLDLVVDPAAHHIVITVRGEIDYFTADQLRRCLKHCVATIDSRVLVLDLTAVTYLGSVGLAILLETTDDLTQRSSAPHSFRVIVDENKPVIRPIQIGGVQSMIRLHHDVDDALSDHQTPDLR
jgi:anti-sigma B factor antagonist